MEYTFAAIAELVTFLTSASTIMAVVTLCVLILLFDRFCVLDDNLFPEHIPEIRLVDLSILSDDQGQPLRLTRIEDQRDLERKRRAANHFITENHRACAAALASVVALRWRPMRPREELLYLVAHPDVPTSVARKAGQELGAWL